VAIEGTRGWKISKEKASHKIDVVVALGIACLAAVRSGVNPGTPAMMATWDNPIPLSIREQRRAQQIAEANVAAGSQPCTLRFAPESIVEEGVTRRLGPPRLW
jgi:hypothetical protein